MEIQQAIVQIGLNWNCEYFTLFNSTGTIDLKFYQEPRYISKNLRAKYLHIFLALI